MEADQEIIDISQITQYESLVIYGAGIVAREVCFCLQENPYNLKIHNFLVSERDMNPEEIFGISVVDICDNDLNKEKVLVLIAVMDKYYDEIAQTLEQEGYHNFISMTFESRLWSTVREKFFIELFQKQGKEYLTLNDCFKLQNKGRAGRKNIKVYRAQSHVDKKVEAPLARYDWEIPIQAGAALTEERICDLCDNRGDHISAKNREYCELTALYWIWKNDNSDYVGLCQYRRHFDLNFHLLDQAASHNIDVILTVPVLNYPSVREIYIHDHIEADWNMMSEAIKALCPEYQKSVEKVQEGIYYYGYNMFLARKEILDAYCEWLFPILAYCEDGCAHKDDVYQNRAIGFLAERLLTIYLMYHEKQYQIVHVHKDFLK